MTDTQRFLASLAVLYLGTLLIHWAFWEACKLI